MLKIKERISFGSRVGPRGPSWALRPAGQAVAGAGPLAGRRNSPSLTSVCCSRGFVFPDPATCLGDGKRESLTRPCHLVTPALGGPSRGASGVRRRRGLPASSGAEPLVCLRVQTSPRGACLLVGKPRPREPQRHWDPDGLAAQPQTPSSIARRPQGSENCGWQPPCLCAESFTYTSASLFHCFDHSIVSLQHCIHFGCIRYSDPMFLPLLLS